MARSMDDLEKRLAELKQEVTKRGFDRHASVLKDISELPPELQSSAVKALSTRQVILKIGRSSANLPNAHLTPQTFPAPCSALSGREGRNVTVVFIWDVLCKVSKELTRIGQDIWRHYALWTNSWSE